MDLPVATWVKIIHKNCSKKHINLFTFCISIDIQADFCYN